MKAGRIVLIVLGSLIVIISLGLMIGGGVILALENNFKDQQGFISTDKIEINANSAAVITAPGDFRINTMGWARPHDFATIKIEADNINSSKPVFIGIARASAVNDYLDGISYSEVRDFSVHQDTVALTTFQGDKSAPAPTSQNIWVASVNGTGDQTLQWDIVSGSYSVVLMNADGSSPIDADVSVGIKIPKVLQAVGLGLLIAGIIFFLGGGVMIFFGARGWGRQG